MVRRDGGNEAGEESADVVRGRRCATLIKHTGSSNGTQVCTNERKTKISGKQISAQNFKTKSD